MEVTVELKDYSIHIENFVMIALEKENSLQNTWFFSYCTVCLSVTSSSHSSEEVKNLLEYDSKEGSLKFHFFDV